MKRLKVRRRSYARHFAGALLLEFPLGALIFQHTLLFSGMPCDLKLEGVIHAERSSEGILIVGAPVAPPADSKQLPDGVTGLH